VATKGEGAAVAVSAANWSTVILTQSGAAFVYGGLKDPEGQGVRLLLGEGPHHRVMAVAMGGKPETHRSGLCSPPRAGSSIPCSSSLH
jgi:hypothetical protein